MNPRLSRLQPYSFERLRQWFAYVTPNPAPAPISLSIGEPRHPAPALVADALDAGMSGLANYPTSFFALAQLPMFMLPALLEPLYRRMLAAAGEAGSQERGRSR